LSGKEELSRQDKPLPSCPCGQQPLGVGGQCEDY